MPSIADTTLEMIEWVFPEHAGGPGQIHGGRMMEWITKAGTLAASRVARGTVVLGAMDDIDFLHPVKVGQIAHPEGARRIRRNGFPGGRGSGLRRGRDHRGAAGRP